MAPLLIFAAIVAFGAIFVALDRASSPRVRRVGPWALIGVACLGICIAFPPMRHRVDSWSELTHSRFWTDALIGLSIVAVFGIEAGLIARWLLRTATKAYAFVLWYACATFAIWLVTFMVLGSLIPGS
jgi:hypothetical protein